MHSPHTARTNPSPCTARTTTVHRIGYLKDVVLPRLLDDATFATLSSLQLFNNIEVCVAAGGAAAAGGRLLPALDCATYSPSPHRLLPALQILMSLHQDREFLPDLFRRLQSAEPGSQEWADLVAFLQVRAF